MQPHGIFARLLQQYRSTAGARQRPELDPSEMRELIASAWRQSLNTINPDAYRIHQIDAMRAITDHISDPENDPSALTVIPTAGGKTRIFLAQTDAIWQAGKAAGVMPNVIVLLPTRQLITQTLEGFKDHFNEVEVGAIDVERKSAAPVTLMTYAGFTQMVQRDHIRPEMVDAIVMDEAHRGLSDLRQSVLDGFLGRSVVTAFSATPNFDDEKGVTALIGAQNEVINVPGQVLRDRRVISPVVNYVLRVDINGNVPAAGLERTALKRKAVVDATLDFIIGAIDDFDANSENGKPLAKKKATVIADKATVFYGADCAHARLYAAEYNRRFAKRRKRMEVVTGEDPTGLVKELAKEVKDGTLHGIANAKLLQEGWDLPEVGLVINSPTESDVVQLQQSGRAQRIDDRYPADAREQIAYVLDVQIWINGELEGAPVAFYQAAEGVDVRFVTATPVKFADIRIDAYKGADFQPVEDIEPDEEIELREGELRAPEVLPSLLPTPQLATSSSSVAPSLAIPLAITGPNALPRIAATNDAEIGTVVPIAGEAIEDGSVQPAIEKGFGGEIRPQNNVDAKIPVVEAPTEAGILAEVPKDAANTKDPDLLVLTREEIQAASDPGHLYEGATTIATLARLEGRLRRPDMRASNIEIKGKIEHTERMLPREEKASVEEAIEEGWHDIKSAAAWLEVDIHDSAFNRSWRRVELNARQYDDVRLNSMKLEAATRLSNSGTVLMMSPSDVDVLGRVIGRVHGMRHLSKEWLTRKDVVEAISNEAAPEINALFRSFEDQWVESATARVGETQIRFGLFKDGDDRSFAVHGDDLHSVIAFLDSKRPTSQQKDELNFDDVCERLKTSGFAIKDFWRKTALQVRVGTPLRDNGRRVRARSIKQLRGVPELLIHESELPWVAKSLKIALPAAEMAIVEEAAAAKIARDQARSERLAFEKEPLTEAGPDTTAGREPAERPPASDVEPSVTEDSPAKERGRSATEKTSGGDVERSAADKPMRPPAEERSTRNRELLDQPNGWLLQRDVARALGTKIPQDRKFMQQWNALVRALDAGKTPMAGRNECAFDRLQGQASADPRLHHTSLVAFAESIGRVVRVRDPEWEMPEREMAPTPMM
jgi:superfamily II DNA or RNA helicase